MVRATLAVEIDVLDAARTPLSTRNGFPVFQIPAGTPGFGPDEV